MLLRILQISTYDISGGAGRAAYRLHRGLRKAEHDCRMLVRYKDTDDRYVHPVSSENQARTSDEALFLRRAIQGHYINSHRTGVSNTLFSLPCPGYDLSMLPLVKEADIINLHWVAQYQSLITLKRLFDLGKPVVWTLHDQWAFTGGCHYAAGCENYQTDCRACPQLAEDPFFLPGAVLKDKLSLFGNVDLTIVTPSRWMGACARKSALFKAKRVEVIPNSLETDRFRPLSKGKAKKRIGLRADTVALLFGGVSGDEKRKGFHKLAEAIGICLRDTHFRNLVK
ncbi:MAG: glycosyltransferase, partial [Deltaproteobacteria bacterium]|nr:glycosyltransferase [Deltaproteobacteria bacterium]